MRLDLKVEREVLLEEWPRGESTVNATWLYSTTTYHVASRQRHLQTQKAGTQSILGGDEITPRENQRNPSKALKCLNFSEETSG